MGIASKILTLMALVAVGATTATQSISLSSFTPRIENLSSSCQSAYVTAIDGCTKNDFTPNVRCSATCVQGLLKISTIVNQSCKNGDVPETSIIGVFLLGEGVQVLCPGVEVTTVSSSSTRPPQQISTRPDSATSTLQARPTNSSPAPSPQSTSNGSSSSSASPMTTAAPQEPNQSVTPPTSTSQSSLVLDTNTPPPAASPTGSQQANQNAGGGSPFDIGATASASHLHLSSIAAMAVLILVISLPAVA